MIQLLTRISRFFSVAVACFSSALAHATPGALTISDAWVRPTVAGQKVTGGYMAILAHQSGQVVGASSPIAQRVEIHETQMDGDIMRMREVPEIGLAAGQKFVLKPGGHHLMLMGLTQPIQPGQSVEVKVQFKLQNDLVLEIPVQAQVEFR